MLCLQTSIFFVVPNVWRMAKMPNGFSLFKVILPKFNENCMLFNAKGSRKVKREKLK